MVLLSSKDLRRISGTIVLVLTGLVSACSTMEATPNEWLDPVTGVSVGRAQSPLRFYRDNSGRAAYARDFVYLGPFWVNTMGDYRYYVWVSAWSTHAANVDVIKRRDSLESITLVADGEPMSLDIAGWTYDGLGASSPVYPKPVATAVDAFYRVTLDQIRILSEASEIRILLAVGNKYEYELWSDERDGRRSLRRFVAGAR